MEKFTHSADPKKRKPRKPEIEFPSVSEFEIPDPPVPNRAHTEMVLGSDGRSGLSDEKHGSANV